MPQPIRRPPFGPGACTLALGALLAAAPALPARAAGMAEAVADGKASVDVRYRYETVDQSDFAEDAAAGTLRTRLGYRTGEMGKALVFLEFENVVTLGADEYDDSTPNGRTSYPVVADPAGTEVNQAYLQQHPAKGVTLRAGRQRIVLDDGRFVGDEAWRQNQRTYDALWLEDAHAADLVFAYAYLWNANDTDLSDRDHDTHLVHLGTRGRPLGDVSAYAYFVNDNDAPTTASQTYGARYAGRISSGDGHTLVTLEYARQGEMAGSGIGSNDYLRGELGSEGKRLTGKVTYEVLGGDGTSAFSMPLGTKHGFDGWADRFTATPPDGLRDLAFTLGLRLAGVRTTGAYHQFKTDSGGTDYGTEWDLAAEKRAGAHTFGVAWAAYNADTWMTDVEKLWVYAGASF